MLMKKLKLKEFLTLDNCIPLIQQNAVEMCDENDKHTALLYKHYVV